MAVLCEVSSFASHRDMTSTAREYFTVELRCACRVTQCGLHYQVLRRDASPAHHPHPTRPRSCIGPSRPPCAATDAIADARPFPDPARSGLPATAASRKSLVP